MKVTFRIIACSILLIMSCFLCEGQVSERDWKAEAVEITGGAKDRYGKAENIYRWICANIAFDTSHTIINADECMARKAGTSQAFCELYQKLAEASGIETYIITGEVKNYMNEITAQDHTWLMVRLDDGWILTDPTWGAGNVENGVFVRSDNDMSWFHTDPYIMITSHYPASKGDQLISPSIDHDTFVKIPYIEPVMGRLGLRGRDALKAATEGTLDLPFVYGVVTDDMLIREIPLKGTVKEGEICRFTCGNSLKYDYEIRIDDKSIPAARWNVNASTRSAEYIIAGEDKMMIYILDKNAPQGEVAAAFEYKIEKGDGSYLEAIEKYDPYLLDELIYAKNVNISFMRELGIDGHKVLEAMRSHNSWEVPVMYRNLEKIQIIDVPLHSPLKVGETYTFEFKGPVDETFVIINDDIWHKSWDRQLKKNGTYKTEMTVSKPGFLGIGINIGGKEYKLLLEYEVTY